MTRSLKITAMALCVAAACGAAQAQTPNGKTRDEVRQELAGARRSGELFAGGESGLTLRELSPGRYPKQPAVAGRSRADVTAELEAAQRSGDVLASGESSLKLNELHPTLYPQHAMAMGKTRAQVLAELAEARRSGDLFAGGESGLTLRELHPGSYPGAGSPVYAGAPAASPARRMN